MTALYLRDLAAAIGLVAGVAAWHVAASLAQPDIAALFAFYIGGPGVSEKPKPDPREPDYSRKGIFQTHNCWRCQSGERPCIKGKGNERDCDSLHARND